MTSPIRVAVTGAAGQIGYALIFRIASGDVFGPKQPVILHLVEVPPVMGALDGVMMELDDCAFPTLAGVVKADSDHLEDGFRGCNFVLCVGSVPRKDGMERKDLIRINGPIFTNTGKAIQAAAAPDVRVVVIGNPCNTNCLIALHNAPKVPKSQWFAMTRLDQNRAATQLAKKAGVEVAQVKSVGIWGNHSSTQFPDFYHATINGRPAPEAIHDEAWLKGPFVDGVQKRGAAVIKARGASSAASAANAIVDTVKSVITPTAAGDTFSAAVCSDGSYGVDAGLIFGYPLTTDGKSWKISQGLEHNAFAREKIDFTLAELRSERDAIRDLLPDEAGRDVEPAVAGTCRESALLREWDNQFVWHPFTPMLAYRDEGAPIIEGADGFFLIDVEGRRSLDGISSLWCNVHGHRVPEIDRAIREQLDRVSHTTLLGLSSVPSIELASELVARAPRGLTKVFYSDSGATAVEVALKIAYQYHAQKSSADGASRRDRFLCLGSAYHGDTLGTVSVGGIPLFHAAYRDLLFETVSVPSPVAFRRPPGVSPEAHIEHCFAELERLVVENRDRAAGFIIEPLVQGAAGILVHPPGYLTRVRQLTREYGIPLIADEVAVGFGKTGTLFACEQEHVSPDLLCVAKGLTGGYLPLAATLATDEIYDAFLAPPHEGKTFFHGHTFTGNALACAAALASIRLFDESHVLENVRSNAARIETRLGALKDSPFVGEIRQKGIMVGIELVRDRATAQPFPPQRRIGHQVTLAARKRGVILRPLGDVVVLMPAPAMPADLIDRLCDVAIESIEEVTRGRE